MLYTVAVQTAAVFVDRDNTLIQNNGDLGEPERVRLSEGVPAGLKALREAGYHVVVVTNQAGVARGAFTEEDVDAVHQRIAALVDEQVGRRGLIDRFYYCPYHPEAKVAEYRRDHPWRKPHPGMILQAARDMGIDLSRSWAIGDQERDVAAGRAAGCRTLMISRDPKLLERAAPTEAARDFPEAVAKVLAHARVEKTQVTAMVVKGADSAREGAADAAGVAGLRRAVLDLIEEMRSERVRRGEFTFMKMLAGLCQLLAVLLALLGLLRMGEMEIFAKWMIGAGLLQLLTLTLLVVDLKS